VIAEIDAGLFCFGAEEEGKEVNVPTLPLKTREGWGTPFQFMGGVPLRAFDIFFNFMEDL
jgi:hypothetical protein